MRFSFRAFARALPTAAIAFGAAILGLTATTSLLLARQSSDNLFLPSGNHSINDEAAIFEDLRAACYNEVAALPTLGGDVAKFGPILSLIPVTRSEWLARGDNWLRQYEEQTRQSNAEMSRSVYRGSPEGERLAQAYTALQTCVARRRLCLAKRTCGAAIPTSQPPSMAAARPAAPPPAPVQAPPAALPPGPLASHPLWDQHQPPTSDPKLITGLNRATVIWARDKQCLDQRNAIGENVAADHADIDAARAMWEGDSQSLHELSQAVAAEINGSGQASLLAAYRACLYEAQSQKERGAAPRTASQPPAAQRQAEMDALRRIQMNRNPSLVAPAFQENNERMAKDFSRDRAEKSNKVHNHANDATSCLSVVATGTKVEWGAAGKFKLVNTCSYPVQASWCANTSDCQSGHGNLWSIGAGKDYPIFFADASAPDIRVGACRTGSYATSKVDVVANGAGASMVDTAHDAPQPAPGVSIMPNHKCD
jgi:hypothetical protein